MDGERFLDMTLRPRVRFTTDVSREITEGLHDRAHAACFIANLATFEVRIDLHG
jgi:organic hydroperoxide reductase OsmC/OhrA